VRCDERGPTLRIASAEQIFNQPGRRGFRIRSLRRGRWSGAGCKRCL